MENTGLPGWGLGMGPIPPSHKKWLITETGWLSTHLGLWPNEKKNNIDHKNLLHKVSWNDRWTTTPGSSNSCRHLLYNDTSTCEKVREMV